MLWCNHWEKESRISILISDTLVTLQQNACVNQSKRIRIPVSGKFLLVESAIFGFGIQNTAPESHKRLESRIQFSLTKTGIHGVESRIQDCLEFPYKGRNVPAILALTGSSLFFYRGCSVLCSCGSSKFIKNHKLRGANINVILRHYRDVNHCLFFFLFQLVHL